MSHNYLLDLKQHLDVRRQAIEGEIERAALTPEARARLVGRQEALADFQEFLCRNYYAKLPKRLYKRLSTVACRAAISRARATGGT